MVKRITRRVAVVNNYNSKIHDISFRRHNKQVIKPTNNFVAHSNGIENLTRHPISGI